MRRDVLDESGDPTLAAGRPTREDASGAAPDHDDSQPRAALAIAAILIAWLLTTLSVVFLPTNAKAISFDVEFRTTTQSVSGSETFGDLLLEHASGTLLSAQTLTGIDGVSSVALAGTNSNYSTLITTSFTAGVTGAYNFEVGTDWGLGGASQAVHLGSGSVIDTYVTSQDVWWNNDWNNADVFSIALNLTAGESYSIAWVGFENCCGGAVSFRFSVNGSPPSVLDDTNFLPYEAPTPVPEPGTALLMGLGLVALARRRS